MDVIELIYRGHHGLRGVLVEAPQSEHRSNVIRVMDYNEAEMFADKMAKDVYKQFGRDCTSIEFNYLGEEYILEY